MLNHKPVISISTFIIHVKSNSLYHISAANSSPHRISGNLKKSFFNESDISSNEYVSFQVDLLFENSTRIFIPFRRSGPRFQGFIYLQNSKFCRIRSLIQIKNLSVL